MKLLEKLVSFQIKYSKIFFILILLFVGLMAYSAKDLKIQTDFTKLVSENSENSVNGRVLETAFGSNDGMILLVKTNENSILENPITNMRDERVTTYLEDAKEALSQSQYVVAIGEPVYSDDDRYVRVGIQLFTPQKVEAFKEVKVDLESYLSEVGAPIGTSSILTGTPTLLDRVSTLLINDNLNTILITLVFIFLILYWYLRDITFSLIAVTTPLFSLIILGGLMVYFDIYVSITLAAVGVLILGLGADYGIHITTHYRKARREHETHKKALIHTIEELFIPISASFVTTLAGFVALVFGVSNSSISQGIVLSLGITIIFLVSFISFPVMLTVFRNKISLKPNESFRKIVNVLAGLAVFQSKRPKTVISVVFVLTLIMIYGASQVQFSTSNSNWIPEGDEVSDTFRELNSVYGSVDSLTIVVKSYEGDLRNIQTMRDLNLIESYIEGIPNVDSVSSPYENLPYDSTLVYDTITNGNIRNSFNNDYTITTLTINSQNLRADDSGNSIVLSEVREIINTYPVHNAQLSLYGDVVQFQELGTTLQEDAGFTTIVSLILVFLVASLIYASVTVGMISLFPIIIAVVWAVGMMGFFKVPFTTLSTSIIALVIGVGIDFSIHLVDSIERFIKRMDLESAIRESLTTSGAAILLASFTTTIGFLALLFAKLLGTQRLGLSLAFSIIAVFFVTISLVPAIMSLKYKNKISKNKND
jgi:predicted RND superfamily exporter protein